MKRIMMITLSILVLLTVSACNLENEGTTQSYIPNTYAGEATGFGGTLKLEVTVDEHAITAIDILEHGETPGVGTNAIEQLPNKIVENQSLAVDSISGCTITSQAIIDAVKNALSDSGADLQALSVAPVNDKNSIGTMEDVHTDIVIVGGGGAGMVAAIEAANQGSDVILIEKMSILGGTTSLASTAFNAGGSTLQLKQDPPYTDESYYKKIIGTKTEDDPAAKQLATRSGQDADWLVSMGADLKRVINGSQLCPEDGSAIGTMLTSVLKKQLDDLQIDYRTDTKATKVIMENDQVSGVEVANKNGNYKIYAKAVILATGGFASSPELVDKYTPQWSGYPSTASAGATGDGIIMAEEAGAALGNMNATSPQTVAFDTGKGAISLTNARYNGAILVNKEGKRFVNELAATEPLGKAIKEQTTGYAYLIFDQVAVDNAELMQNYKDRGYFTEADTIEKLASKLELDAEALAQTIEQYQGYVDAGEDIEFGRKDSMFTRIDTPKYYGAKISPASQITNGGVMIDLHARALREDGTVIKGLYIGGETANQAGNGLTVAVVIGRLAAQTAVADIQ